MKKTQKEKCRATLDRPILTIMKVNLWGVWNQSQASKSISYGIQKLFYFLKVLNVFLNVKK